MEKAEAYINNEWIEIYPEYWLMSNSTGISSYLYHTPVNKVKLRCCGCKEEVFICALGDGMKKNPYFAHKQCKEEDDDTHDCNLRTSNEVYKEIFKFEKPRANTYESAVHREMKRFAVSKFWSKENKYVVLRDEDIYTYNRDENTKLRADLLAAPLHSGNANPIQRTEQYIFEGQTTKNLLSVNHIKKAIEYKKVGFLEENIINAYSIDHLKRATYISNNYTDILNLQGLDKTEIDERIGTNKEKRGSIINMLEQTTVDEISGYYAFHADAEFLLALKDYSNNHLLFMYIPITEEKNELEEKNKHKRGLILASVLDTITIKNDYCIIAYLYFKDITYITDITEYQNEVSMYKNKTIEFCQNSLHDIGKRYVEDINKKDKEILSVTTCNRDLQDDINKIQFESQKLITEKENEINGLKTANSELNISLSQRKEEISTEIELKLRKDLKNEYMNLEKLKSEYSLSYSEVAAVVERNIKEELGKQYSRKYASLTDGQTNASKMANCRGNHIKYLMEVENYSEAEISNNIKCPNISGVALKGYMEEYLKTKMSICAKCEKYK
ncbi:hypothetical protein G9F72_010765 [Clostridium estertheticum]|uniref:hypothetical protein n=1 Tax=Clostridium estertheticum TaxID=238834 RepID=UPI0013E947B3|nr:hypothetical protein [Clostridium estertheticum]MBZ9686806.1 hypothetical protein [Clostridium estertheticum]